MNRASLRVFCYRAKSGVLSLGALAALLVHAPVAKAELSTADPLGFFTNLSSRLLQSELGLNLNRIQIYPTNQYTPAVHRLLQVTANILDATTNRFNTNYPCLPSVFRPLFTNDNDQIYICGYEEENGLGYTNAWRDLNDPVARAALQQRDCVYGIPVIIGVKKGFPNFNEFALQTVFQITRRLQITRPSVGAPRSTWQTNQMFILGISNVIGVELWNSYESIYTRAADVIVTNVLSATLTNDFGFAMTQQWSFFSSFSVAASNWTGYGSSPLPNTSSFLVPIRMNVVSLPDAVYLHGTQSFSLNLGSPFETGIGFPIPKWGITLNNRLWVFMVDQETQRLVDFVTLEGLNSTIDLSEAIRDPDSALGFDGLWSTNLLSNTTLPQSVFNQLDISLGHSGGETTDWRNYGLNQLAGSDKAFAIDYFRAFYGLSPLKYSGIVNTSLVQICPFTPTRRIAASHSWQANDPLVHSTRMGLQSTDAIGRPPLTLSLIIPGNIGVLNERYSPWGGNPLSGEDSPNNCNAAIKDPLAWRSGNWDFPNSEPLSLAMLGRVHRGTPWQTIYLKSAKADAATWLDWLHNGDAPSAELTHPTRDWQIAALIASLLNTNPPQQLLSVNDRDPNAWLTRLDGLNVLTNTSTDSWLQTGKSPTFDSLTTSSNSTQAASATTGVASARATQTDGVFRSVGEVLATSELTMASPWLNQSSNIQVMRGISDEAYERLPSQLLPLLRADSVGSVIRTSSNLQLRFTGFDNYPYAIESSADLLNWSSISTNYPTNGVFSIPLSPANNQFFRSRLLP